MSVVGNVLNKYTSEIEDTIKRMLETAPLFIQGVITYHFGWVDQNFEPANFKKGKMLRPTICLLVFEALTGHYKEALPVAGAIELIHNFTLIHDDIEDGDRERRGRPTAWAIWGQPLAINVGDFLYTLAFKCLYQLDSTKFAPETVFSVFRLINESCLNLTAGQDLDIRFERIQDVSTDMYIDMVYKKTGALIEAAIISGATLGTTDQEIIKNYHQFAQNIGIAFQVRDDILGIWGDTAETGKSAENDLRRKKKTLPIIYMLERSSGQRREKLETLYATPEPLADDQIEFVRENLEWAGAYNYAQNTAGAYRQTAFAALNRIGISNQAQSELEIIAKFLVDRSR